MMELRWVKRSIIIGQSKDGTQYQENEKVLQYRTKVMQMGYGYSTGKDSVLYQYERPMGEAWTEWTDVPSSFGDQEKGNG